MATYWVGATGSDANTGLSYAQRKLTWTAVMALATAKGDVVNVASTDGALTIASTESVTLSNRNGGTSFSDPGLTIQGVNSSGVATQTELRFSDNTTAQNMLAISNAGATDPAYIIVQGLYVNWAAMTVTTHNKNFIVRSNGSTDNNIRVQCNKFEMALSQGGTAISDHALLIADGGRLGEVRYNYFHNCDDGGGSQLMRFHHRGQVEVHHNVLVLNAATAFSGIWASFGNNDGNSTDHRFYNNTVYVKSTATGVPYIWASLDSTGSTGGNADKQCHSNVIGHFPAALNARYMQGFAGVASTTYDRVIGYTLFSVPNGNSWDAAGPYQVPWDPDDSDSPEGTSRWATDVLTTSDVFFDKATPWSWANINGSGYSMTLAGDLRIADTSNWRTMALDGGVPGAIEDSVAAGPDLTIDLAHSADYIVGGIGVFTIVVSNIGDTTATATLTVTDTLPTGLTYRGSSGSGWVVLHAGQVITATYAGDLLAGGVTTTLIVTVNVASTAIPSVTNSASVTSTDDVPGGEDDDLILVSPAPVILGNNLLLSEANPARPDFHAALHLQRNTALDWQLPAAQDDTVKITRAWNARVELAAGAGPVDLPMIIQPGHLMLQTDQDLLVYVNSTTQLIRGGGCLLITEATLTTFQVTNQSAFKTANITYFGAGSEPIGEGGVPDDGGTGSGGGDRGGDDELD